MVDLQADRHHPIKRRRPLAAGELSLRTGLIAAVVSGAAAFAVASALPARFVAALLIYLVLTTAYSLGLKRMVAIDVLALAALYTVRLWAGSAAADVPISRWLIAFSLCVFLSLALMKRYTELLDLDAGDATLRARGRGYIVNDARLIRLFGPIFGLLAAVVMMCYVTGETSRQYYHRPAWLWLVGPLLAVWLGRMWWLAHRGRMHSDPVLFAVRDWPSYVLGALIVAVGVAASIA
jgi:4-hydroxybenzoate polyprenyltransferase